MKKLLILVSLCFLLLVSAPAEAHVLIESESGDTRAVLHVTPDDDPIAGEATDFYFDVRGDNFNGAAYSYSLSITGHDKTELAAVELVGSSGIQSKYVFASQGVYDIELSMYPNGVAQSDQPIVFRYVQRVTRGTAGSAPQYTPPAWAEAGLIGTLCAVLGILIIIINRRQAIAAFSRDEAKRRPR